MSTLKETLFQLGGGGASVITVHRELVEFTGDLRAGMMLSQLLYWHGRSNLDGWTCAKSDEEFQEELCLSRYGVRKARSLLEDLGIIHTEVLKYQGHPTTHYALNEDDLLARWTEHITDEDESHCGKSNNGISDIEQSNVRNHTMACSKPNNDARAHNAGARSETTAETTAETTTKESVSTTDDTSSPRSQIEKSWTYDYAIAAMQHLEELDLLAPVTENKIDREGREAVAAQWADTFRLLQEQDGYSPAEIKEALSWLFEGGNFWTEKGALASVPSLRRKTRAGDRYKFDVIYQQSQEADDTGSSTFRERQRAVREAARRGARLDE